MENRLQPFATSWHWHGRLPGHFRIRLLVWKRAYLSSSSSDYLLLCLFIHLCTCPHTHYCLFGCFASLSICYTQLDLYWRNISCRWWLICSLIFSALAFLPGLGLKRPYEDGAMDDKDLIKKMKRNLRKGTKWWSATIGLFLLLFCSFTSVYFK